ncbi:WD repeat, SAM and U-box domain-containing protein 1-like [Cimex lectularius]|uniref:U-box domain-containing protein n=1 Tax=Cimex lectularius TaxID=79782 RepID=A0A8I6R8A4_CIMLE|nr:WD repeat, SAM and U-box domain-containing protein 1-like [Cimex lectularius]
MGMCVDSAVALQRIARHTSDVTSCDFSDRFHLASGSGDKSVALFEWKASTGYVEVLFSPFTGHKYAVTSVRFSPRYPLLASASVDGHINLWNIKTGDCIQTLVQANGSGVRCLSFSQDSSLLASGGEGGILCVWSITLQKITLIKAIHGHNEESVQGISFSPDQHIIVSGDVTGTFKIWSLAALREEAEPSALVTFRDAHDLGINYLEFSPEFTLHTASHGLLENIYLLATCGNDHTIALWQVHIITDDKQNTFCRATVSGPTTRFIGHNSAVTQVRISPRGDLIASASIDKTIRIWQISSGRCLKTLEKHSRYVTSCAFSSDQSLLVSGSNDKAIIVWDLKGNLNLHSDIVGHGSRHSPQFFSSVLSNPSKEKDVILLHELENHLSSVNSISFSKVLLVSGGSDHKINIWRWTGANNITLLHSIENAHRYTINQVDICDKTGILASCSLDGTVVIWDPELGKIKKSGFHVSGSGVRSVKISPDSHLIAAGGDDDLLHIYNLDTYETIAKMSMDNESLTGISFTPDSKYIMAGTGEGHCKLFSLMPTVTPIYMLENAHDLGVSGMDFAETVHAQLINDGRYELVTAGQDGIVKVWNININCSPAVSIVWNLTGHGGSVTCVKYSPCLAELIASTSIDKTCRLWDPYSGNCLHVIESQQRVLTSCAFSPDATMLATGSLDKNIMIWRLPGIIKFRSFMANDNCINNIETWSVDVVNKWLQSQNFPPGNLTGKMLLETSIEDILSQLNIDDMRKELLATRLAELRNKNKSGPPHEFLCPITHQIMQDPVVASDGFTYERSAIQSWFASGHCTSPMTNSYMVSQELNSNRLLKENIVAYLSFF